MRTNKKHLAVRFDKLIISWQGWQSVVQTFDLDEDLDIEKIKALLNESEVEERK